MFTENTLDQNLLCVVGEVEQPQEEAIPVIGLTIACQTLYHTCANC